ncbi:fibronectin type III-like domain-contianing protein [Cystobacter fuscus]
MVSRPDKELKAFTKVALEPGEEKTVRFTLSRRDFAYYNTTLHRWSVNPGRFDILVGGSSRTCPCASTSRWRWPSRRSPRCHATPW